MSQSKFPLAPSVERLSENKRTMMHQVDELLKRLHVDYTQTESTKTIVAEVYFLNFDTKRRFVVGTGTAFAYYEEQQDIPRGQASAYEKAREEARTFLTNFVLFQNFRKSAEKHADGLYEQIEPNENLYLKKVVEQNG